MLDMRDALVAEHRRDLLAEAERQRMIRLARGQEKPHWMGRWSNVWRKARKKWLGADAILSYRPGKQQTE